MVSSNCTFMELKFVEDQFCANWVCGVLIVPLWNWNEITVIFFFFSTVLIVPLWNWNLFLMISKKLVLCSNCTFMELKCWSKSTASARGWVLIVPLWNWNRTSSLVMLNSPFVLIVPLWNWNESDSFKDPEDSGVLIVPLWNWNKLIKVVRMFEESSNCTFMELK